MRNRPTIVFERDADMIVVFVFCHGLIPRTFENSLTNIRQNVVENAQFSRDKFLFARPKKIGAARLPAVALSSNLKNEHKKMSIFYFRTFV
jgi:hypothetical protein